DSSGLSNQTILTCGTLTMVAGHYGAGQKPATLATKDQSGSQDRWSAYLEFSSPVTAECTFALPAGTTIGSIADLVARVNYRGPKRSEQSAVFEVFDPSTMSWVQIGDNSFAKSWTWTAADLHVPGNPQRLFGAAGVRARYRVTQSVDVTQL